MTATTTTSQLHEPHPAGSGNPPERPGRRARCRAAPASHEGGATAKGLLGYDPNLELARDKFEVRVG